MDGLGDASDEDPISEELGLRKARFFDGCLRADRALEAPRLQFEQAHGAVDVPRSRVSAATGAETPTSQGLRPVTAADATEVQHRGSALLSPLARPWNPPEEVLEPSLAESMNGFVGACRRVKIHPATTGLVRQDSESLKLEYGCMTDTRAEAVAHPLKASSHNVREASLRSNGLGPRGARHLLAALPEGVQTINLSQNELGRQSFKKLTNPVTFQDEHGAEISYELDGRRKLVKSVNGKRQVGAPGSDTTGVVSQLVWSSLPGWAGTVKDQHGWGSGISDEKLQELRILAVRAGVLHNLPGPELGVVELLRAELADCGQMCQSFRRLSALRSLNVSDSNLGDGICKMLCEALIGCRHLQELDLSGNNIHKGTTAIAHLIRGHKSLEKLDMNWNHASGDAARDLVRGLYDNGQLGAGKLRDVNLSWNPLGTVGGENTCRLLAQVFAEENTLQHLDLSNCELSSGLCQILADGLKANNSLLGVHLRGNEATVSPRGFIVPVQPEFGILKERPIPAAEPASACWVCERWRETRISYVPGVSGPDDAEVFVFTSVDSYEEPTRMTRLPAGDGSRCAELVAYVMCPKGLLHYAFQIGSRVLVSRTAPLAYDTQPVILKRARVKGDPPVGEDVSSATFEVTLTDVNVMTVVAREPGVPACQAIAPRRTADIIKDFPPRDWDVRSSVFAPYDEALERRSFCERCFEADWKNSRLPLLVDDASDRIQVKEILRNHYAEIKVLYSSLCSSSVASAPRPLSRSDSPEYPPTPKSEASILSESSTLSPTLSPASPVLEEPAQVLPQMPETLAPVLLVYGVGVHEYTHLLIEHSLLGDEIRLEDADAHFLLAAAPQEHHGSSGWHKASHTGGRVVQRHGFFELLTRLAMMRYTPWLIANDSDAKAKLRAKVRTASGALESFFTKHIIWGHGYASTMSNLLCVEWRASVLWTEAVESVYRRHMQATVEPLFCAAARSSGALSVVEPEGWQSLLDALGSLPTSGADQQMNRWNRAWLWQMSAMSHTDELVGSPYRELRFVEFLEALGRLVGLEHARSRPPGGDGDDGGEEVHLGTPPPSVVFSKDKAGAMDKDRFAALLDNFLTSDRTKLAIENLHLANAL